MKCGVCGGGVRGFSGTYHGRPIKDWKHTDVPPGTKEHRPVLGTPVDQESLDRIHRPKKEVQDADPHPEVVRPPLVASRPARPEELEESQSASQLLRLLEDHRWELIEQPHYFVAATGIEYFVVRARRRDLAVIVTWRRRLTKKWELELAIRVAQGLTRQVGSEQLKDWIKQRDERCPECGRSSIVHEGGECP